MIMALYRLITFRILPENSVVGYKPGLNSGKHLKNQWWLGD